MSYELGYGWTDPEDNELVHKLWPLSSCELAWVALCNANGWCKKERNRLIKHLRKKHEEAVKAEQAREAQTSPNFK